MKRCERCSGKGAYNFDHSLPFGGLWQALGEATGTARDAVQNCARLGDQARWLEDGMRAEVCLPPQPYLSSRIAFSFSMLRLAGSCQASPYSFGADLSSPQPSVWLRLSH